jgi:hypothetical protein
MFGPWKKMWRLPSFTFILRRVAASAWQDVHSCAVKTCGGGLSCTHSARAEIEAITTTAMIMTNAAVRAEIILFITVTPVHAGRARNAAGMDPGTEARQSCIVQLVEPGAALPHAVLKLASKYAPICPQFSVGIGRVSWYGAPSSATTLFGSEQ